MPLPKLETPTYELTLPSTGQRIKYRPFLVREYKILLTSLESDAEEIHRVVTELIDVCTFNSLNASKLPSFDIEYIFLHIRAKSIGENTSTIITCKNCQNKIEHVVDITKATIHKNPEHTNKIEINDTITLEMRYPNFKEVLDIFEEANSDKIVELVCSCIDTVYTENEYYKLSDHTKEEIDEFINSFSKAQFDKLENFFLTMPKLKQEINAVCSNCNTKNEIIVEGLQNFFG